VVTHGPGWLAESRLPWERGQGGKWAAEGLMLDVCFAVRSEGDGVTPSPCLDLPRGLRKFWGPGILQDACSTSLPVEQARRPSFKQSRNTLEKECGFGGKQREREQGERSPQTPCLSVAARVFIYPPVLGFYPPAREIVLLGGPQNQSRRAATVARRGAAARLPWSKREERQARGAGSKHREKNQNVR